MNNTPSCNADTALMLIDVQNSFFHPRGENYYQAAGEIIAPMRRLLANARQAKCTVIHIAERHRANLNDFEQHKLPEHCIAGGWDAEFFEGFGPNNSVNEFLLLKRRMSAFCATDLDLLLREKHIKQLVIVGSKANVCVRATVQDAFSLGYRCLVVREAVNSNRAHLTEAALEDIDRYMGWVVNLEQAEEALL